MMTNREILEQAHALIQQQKYREARQLLQPIADHPTAAKWIAKIDELTANSAAKASLSASRPAPQTTPQPKTVDDLFDKPRPGAQPAAKALKPATKSAAKSSSEQAISLVYTLFGIGVVLVLIYGFTRETIIELFNPLVTFSDDRITLNHGAGWEVQPFTEHGYCKDVYDECLYFVKTSPNVGLLVDYVPLTNYSSSGEVADTHLDEGLNDATFPESGHQFQDLTIGGFPATAMLFSITEYDENGGEFYMVDIFIVDGLDSYLINLFANTACNLNRRIDDINTVLSSMRFRSTNVPTAEDGYTAATPVALTIPACS